MSTSGYPGTSGGTRVYTGRGNSTSASASNYVDITGLSAGTTYYFTCTSYVDNVGWGSSYNVTAKTSGLVLYDYGYNPYGFAATASTASIQSNHMKVTGGYIYSGYTQSPWRAMNPTINLSGTYSKIHITFNGTLGNCYLNFQFNNNRNSATIPISTYKTSNGSTITLSVDINSTYMNNVKSCYSSYGNPNRMSIQQFQSVMEQGGEIVGVIQYDLSVYQLYLT
jgi:hypothetical protein